MTANSQTPPAPVGTGSRLALLLIIFVDGLGIALVLPMMPLLLGAQNPASLVYAAGWPQQALDVFYGLVLASYAFAMMLGAPLLGSLSDRIGRRDTLLIAVGGALIGYGLSASAVWAGSAALFVAARLLGGAFAGSVPVAQALLLDAPGAAMKSIGLVMFAMTSGFFFGPLLGGLALGAAPAGAAPAAVLMRPFLFALALTALCLALAWRLPRGAPRRPAQSGGVRALAAQALGGFAVAGTRRPLLALLFLQLGWNLLYQYLPLLLDRGGHGLARISWTMAAAGAGMCAAFVWLAGALQGRFAPRTLAIAGAAGVACAAVGLVWVLDMALPLLLVWALLGALGYGLVSCHA